MRVHTFLYLVSSRDSQMQDESLLTRPAYCCYSFLRMHGKLLKHTTRNSCDPGMHNLLVFVSVQQQLLFWSTSYRVMGIPGGGPENRWSVEWSVGSHLPGGGGVADALGWAVRRAEMASAGRGGREARTVSRWRLGTQGVGCWAGTFDPSCQSGLCKSASFVLCRRDNLCGSDQPNLPYLGVGLVGPLVRCWVGAT